MLNTITNSRKYTYLVIVEADLEVPFTLTSSNTKLKKSIKKLNNSTLIYSELCKYKTTVSY